MNELKKLFYKIQELSNTISELRPRFDELIEEKYGYHYSDKDLDMIIDCVDYGTGTMSFKEFDKMMRDNKDD